HGRRARARHRTRDGTRHYLGSRRPPHLSARRGGRHTRSGCHLPRRAWSPSPSALTLAPRVSVGVGVGLGTAITARQVSLVKIRATCISPTAGASISVPLLREKQHAAIVARRCSFSIEPTSGCRPRQRRAPCRYFRERKR